MSIKLIFEVLVAAIAILGVFAAIIPLFVEVKRKIPITLSKMALIVVLLLFFSIVIVYILNATPPSGGDDTGSGSRDAESNNEDAESNNEDAGNALTKNTDDESPEVRTPNEAVTETKYKIECYTSNYSGTVTLSSNFANYGETITVIIDAYQFHSIYIIDADNNPIEPTIPPVLGNTISCAFSMPASDVAILIEGE